MNLSKQNNSLPKWVIIWLVISMLVVFWDSSFILLRPASFKHGSLSIIWIPYIQYIKIDTSYADMKNAFVKAQAIMSLAEIVIGIIALYLNYLRKYSAAIIFAYSTFLLTGTKTILIFLVETMSGFKHVGHNPIFDLIFFYILPNSIWIIIPFFAVFSLGRSMATQLSLDKTEQPTLYIAQNLHHQKDN